MTNSTPDKATSSDTTTAENVTMNHVKVKDEEGAAPPKQTTPETSSAEPHAEPTIVTVLKKRTSVKSAFTFFRELNHDLLMEESAGMTVLDSAVYIGGRWQKLPQEEKDVYHELEAEDRVRMEECTNVAVDSLAYLKSRKARRTTNYRLKAPAPNRTAFQLFCIDYTQKKTDGGSLKSVGENTCTPVMSTAQQQEAWDAWNALPDSERQEYTSRAELEEIKYLEAKRRLFEGIRPFRIDSVYSSLLSKPDAPVAAHSAFYYFCSARYDELASGPLLELPASELEQLTVAWNLLSRQDKQLYVEREMEDAVRFENEVDKYVLKNDTTVTC